MSYRGFAAAALLGTTIALTSAPVAAAQEDALPPPPAVSAVPIPDGQIADAISALDTIAAEMLQRSGIPGMAIGVVHGDEIAYAKGFGRRNIGSPAPVDANTVFQIASISKPLGASVVARVAERKGFSWDDPVVRHLPWFRLSDRFVTRRVTIADLYSHRSGLPGHAGDLLEDLGFRRAQILRRLRHYDLSSFRDSYAYTNFGMTAAGVAAARAAGETWPSLSRKLIYRPLGMKSTSSRFADYRRARNRADLHVQRSGRWQALYRRNADAQSPAGGASSTALDMSRWMRMMLNDGRVDNRRILRPRSVLNLRTPRITSDPPFTPDSRSGFYALGMNITDDATGRVRLSHSGAFALGAGTNMVLLPSERLGIIVLTNGSPLGIAEAVAATFMDLATRGKVERDWYEAYNSLLAPILEESGRLAGRERPARPRPALPLRRYTGTYRNRLYGPARVVRRKGRLFLRLGPRPEAFALRHWSGNTFSYRPPGENATGIAAVDFRVSRSGARRMRIENLDGEGKGTFIR